MERLMLFCSGLSGTGKSYFIENILPRGNFYKLKSATTRAKRPGERDGREYYFRDESYFETEKLATRLFVNEMLWRPGEAKWLYGVPEFEIYNHLEYSLVYDVIQPRYVRQMVNWFRAKGLDNYYDFKILWFVPSNDNFNIAEKRQNMPNDLAVRKMNTCNEYDFMLAGFNIYKDVEPVNSYTVAQNTELMKYLEHYAKQK